MRLVNVVRSRMTRSVVVSLAVVLLAAALGLSRLAHWPPTVHAESLKETRAALSKAQAEYEARRTKETLTPVSMQDVNFAESEPVRALTPAVVEAVREEKEVTNPPLPKVIKELIPGDTRTADTVIQRALLGPPYTGTFKSQNPLAAFKGQDPKGRWILKVADVVSADIGSVRAFSLIIGGRECGGAASGSCPTVSRVSPTAAAAGSQVTIKGANLSGVTAVKFANNRSATFQVDSSTQITATVPANAVTGPITLSSSGCPDAATSVVVVGPANSVPTLTSVVPNIALVGSQAANLTLNGSNFTARSVALWNGAPRPTRFISSGQLIAVIPASDLTAKGTASVQVFSPTPGGGLSNTLIFRRNSNLFEQEPNETPAQANPIAVPGVKTGAAGVLEDAVITHTSLAGEVTRIQDVYRLDLAVTSRLGITLDYENFFAELNVFLMREGGSGIEFLAYLKGPRQEVKQIVTDPLPPGRYLIGVGARSLSSSYTIIVLDRDAGQARDVRAVFANVAPGGTISIPIELASQGEEQSISFSLAYDPSILNSVEKGMVGLTLLLPAGQELSPGARQLIVLRFVRTGGDDSGALPIVFGDQPTARELVDAAARPLVMRLPAQTGESKAAEPRK